MQKIVARARIARTERQPHEHVWRECFDLSFPERGQGISGDLVTSAGDVQRKKALMFDGTGRDALRTLGAGIIGGVTPSNQQWAELDAGDESDAEKQWLSTASRTLWENIHNSNYDAEILDCIEDMGPAGWFVLYIDEAEQGGYAFEAWPIAECCIGQSRKAGAVDIVYRHYRMRADQVVAEFGSNASERVQRLVEQGKGETEVAIVRVIEPRRNSNGHLARNMPFRSVTIEEDTKQLLRESGYHDFPCVVPRWKRLPGSVYATGPYLDALADVKTLNELVQLELAAADVAVAGMWIAQADGVLNPSAIKIGPRKVVAAASVDHMKELKSGSDFNVSFTIKAELQRQIRRTLMADQLEPQDKPQMTAYEVSVRVALIRQLLGPIYGRFQAEFLTPMIERCFGLAYRAGVLGEMPESLRQRAYTVRFKSPLARAQQLDEVTAIEQSLRLTGELAQAKQDESVWDGVKLDDIQRFGYEARGVPMRFLRTPDEIAEVRERRAEDMEQQQQQLRQQEMAATVAQNMGRAA
ncbi:MAG: head-tail connector protein [Gammaproteobacteria bacterium]|nr:head-tail connector protein [Gammaproteobacteria bacterium]